MSWLLNPPGGMNVDNYETFAVICVVFGALIGCGFILWMEKKNAGNS
jgi:hypothetical protein